MKKRITAIGKNADTTIDKDVFADINRLGICVGQEYEVVWNMFHLPCGTLINASLFEWEVVLPEKETNLKAGDIAYRKAGKSLMQGLPKTETHLNRQAIIEKSKCFGSQEDGSHYTDMQLQPLQATYLRYGVEGLKAAIHTKVDKYISRKKDNEVVQLKKAQHCLSILVEITELEAGK